VSDIRYCEAGGVRHALITGNMVLPIMNSTKSFWIEGAKSDLEDYRSTEELPNEVDVVIVGSGYTGATAAYWLHRVSQLGSCICMN
jgi:hypothetical protein